MNQYESAIVSVGSILENFDHDKLFPVYGFGGIPWYNRAAGVSHCFNLTGVDNPCVYGTHGILQAYKNSFLNGTGLYGPTMFSYFLEILINDIESRQPVNEYTVILIITDGAIHDMEKTKD